MTKKTLFTLLIVAVATALAVMFHARDANLLLQGEVNAHEVIISSKAEGRVVERLVRHGDDVVAGQPVVTLEAPELVAQLKAAQAARDQAQAQLDMSINGTRKEQIANLQTTLADAQAKYRNARDVWVRNAKVAAKGFVSAQELEDSLHQRDSAWQQVQAAQANLEEGYNGDRIEQRQGYLAQLQQAEQQLLEIKAQSDELNVVSPVAGEVGPIPAEVGELLNAGSPLLTVIELPRAWFVFYLREDILAHVRKGDVIHIRVPALDNQVIEAEVHYIAPLGDYATKRATRATGDFDLKTFEVRLYPVKPVAGLRQGMSELWQWKV